MSTFSLDRRVAPPPRARVGLIAMLLRRFAVLIAVIAVWQRAILRRRAPWRMVGSCQSCGKCCENLLLDVGDGRDSALVRWLRRYWHEQVFDFYPKANVLDGGYQAYGCRNFTAQRTCARYSLRPFICRAYPALALFERPRPKAHCGFKIVDESMSEIFLTAGARTTSFAVGSWIGAYDAALERWEKDFQEPRHNLQFSGINARGLVFEASPKLTLPAGYAWCERPRTQDAPKEALRKLAHALGFPLFGVTTPALPEHYTARFSRWLADGAHAGMGFLERAKDKRLDPTLVQPNAKSVIVLATPYAPDAPTGDAKVARYASVRDYHAVIPPRLAVIKRVLRQLGSDRNFVSSDTGPVLERAYAERAGIGWIGKNGMLISRTHGSYILLATVWTSLQLVPDAPHEEFCGSCDACRPACPTSAIPEPGYVDARKCLSYWTIEHAGELPEMSLHGWLFGCDVCQEACPWTRFASSPAIRALAERRLLPENAEAWAALDGKALETLIDGTPMKRAGAGGLRRNSLRVYASGHE